VARSRILVALFALVGGIVAAVLLVLAFQNPGPGERPAKSIEIAEVKPPPQPAKEEKKAPVLPAKEDNKPPVPPAKEIVKEDVQPPPPVKVIPKEEEKAPILLAKEITNSIHMKLVLVPAGKFVMGSPRTEVGRLENESPHEVEITKPFYLGQYEVKVGEFAAFVAALDYKTDAEKVGSKGGRGWDAKRKAWVQKRGYNWWQNGLDQTGRHPVVNVSWNDAVAFCQWLSAKEGKTYRLPTEAEWEYSCRAGTTTRFHSGEEEDTLKTVAHYAKHKPGTPEANAWGLYDMHGNVWEWCQDWYDKDYYKTCPKQDPQGPVGGVVRVLRGGSFAEEAERCRAAYRSCVIASWDCSFDIGFRVVCEP
jgi:formylglycine-generating enzyme required for sulfatase activity